MLRILKPYIENHGSKSRCCCDIQIDGETRTVWFETDRQFEQFFCTDRVDAYVVGLLSFAMREGHDILSEVPVTDELLYNIRTILIPSLCNHSGRLKRIHVDAPMAPALIEGKEIGTGCSCGVDSFSSIVNHTNTQYKQFDLTYLAINNVGAFNECYSSYGIEKVKDERYVAARKAAEEMSYPLMETNSNFWDAFYQNHLRTNTFSSCFAIYMMQRFWKIYYLASNGIDYAGFSLEDNDLQSSSHYDLLTLQCFSTSGLKILCDGGEKSRLEKTIDISDYEPARKYLHVCTSKPYNCGQCPKCIRTLLTLDLIGKLDDFRLVFNVDEYVQNREKHYRWLYLQHKKHDLMQEPVYLEFNKRSDFKRTVLPEKIKYNVFKKLHLPRKWY